jgi:hypothetical protein
MVEALSKIEKEGTPGTKDNSEVGEEQADKSWIGDAIGSAVQRRAIVA